MADNLPVTPGSGATVATDDVGGIHYQITKQAFGALDSATLVSAANGLPVNIISSNSGVYATSPVPVSPGQYALAVTSTSGSTTLTVPGTATFALITVDLGAGDVRWTRDGTTPTATIGHLLQAGDTFEFDNLGAIKMFATSSGTTVQVSYHHY